MIERALMVILLAVVLGAGLYALRIVHVRRMRPVHSGRTTPTLLYFRGDHCAVCPTQERLIQSLAPQWNDAVAIERIDAERDSETATRYHVFSLPTTIWLDSDGRVRHVNYGLTDAYKLSRQAAELLERPPATDRRQPLIAELLSVSGRPSAAGGLRSNLIDESTL